MKKDKNQNLPVAEPLFFLFFTVSEQALQTSYTKGFFT
jgi:hypothetical protein